MLTYTVDDVLDQGPCFRYCRSRLETLWAGRAALTAREISELEIPIEDRLWAIVAVCLDATQGKLLVCDFADKVFSKLKTVHIYDSTAVKISRLYAQGLATFEELKAIQETCNSMVRHTPGTLDHWPTAAIFRIIRYAAEPGDPSADKFMINDIIYNMMHELTTYPEMVETTKLDMWRLYLSCALEYAEGKRQ